MMTPSCSTCWEMDLSGFEYVCGGRLQGGNLLVCIVHRSASFVCLFLRAAYHAEFVVKGFLLKVMKPDI